MRSNCTPHGFFKKMKHFQSLAKFILILLLLFKIVVNSIALSVNSICEFYKKEVPSVGTFFRSCNDCFFYGFWCYTGFDTGYGFFAPNVASDFVIVNKTEYQDGHVTTKLSDSPLLTREGRVRFAVLNQCFMKKLTERDKADTCSDQYFKILLKRVNGTVPVGDGVKQVTTILYIYDHQALTEYTRKPAYKLYVIDEYKRTVK